MTRAMRTLVTALAMGVCGVFLFFLAVWWHKPTWNADDWAVVESVSSVRHQGHALGIDIENYAAGICAVHGRLDQVIVSSESERSDRGLLERIDADGTADIIVSVEHDELPDGASFGSSVISIPALGPNRFEFVVGGGRGHRGAYSHFRWSCHGGAWIVNAAGSMSFVAPPTLDSNVGCSLSYMTEASDGGAWIAVGASDSDEGTGAVHLLHVSPSGEGTWHETYQASKLALESEAPLFGASVACLANDERGVVTVAVGAPGVWTDKGVYGVSDKGWVGIFEWSEGRGMELTRVVTPTNDIDAGAYVRHFGRSLAWDGSALIVGSEVSAGFEKLNGVQDELAFMSEAPGALWRVDTAPASKTVGINLRDKRAAFYVDLGRTLGPTGVAGEVFATSFDSRVFTWRLRIADD